MSEQAAVPDPAPAPAPPQDDAAQQHDSPTHNTQMTESPPLQAEGSKWSCEVCTYENFPLSRKCTMCLTPKPGAGEDIFRLQDGAAAAAALPDRDHTNTNTNTPHHAVGGAEGAAERARPLRIAEPHAAAAAAGAGTGTAAQPRDLAVAKWPCPTCTYENWPKSLKCAMCGTHSPLPHSHAALDKRERDVHTPVGINDICNSQNASLESEGGKRSKRRNHIDWVWLQACLGVVEGDRGCVEAYLCAGGDPARALSPREVALLHRPSAFDTGHTLVHLAIRFQRQDILSMLLSRISGGGPGIKRSPSYIAPDLAASIRRHLSTCLRLKKGPFPARYVNEFCTFSLPPEIEELPMAVQEQVFAELLDRDAQTQLELHPPALNWSQELTCALGSKLYALWNRSAGDCLPDAVCQAAYGVADRHNLLRAALADTMVASRALFDRWAESERAQGCALEYCVEESELRSEWARLRHAAATPATPLHQIHVFALAHVMRRPIIVYGVNVVHSFRGEAIGYAGFQGIYLPLLWEPEFCCKSPLALGYTRGHFSALVAIEPYPQPHAYICQEQEEDMEECIYLPLTDCDGKLLPVHFLTCEETCNEESIVRRWVRSVVTGGGLLCGTQRLHARPLPQAQMLEEWLNHYRRLAQQSSGVTVTRGALSAPPADRDRDLSSDPDTDDE